MPSMKKCRSVNRKRSVLLYNNIFEEEGSKHQFAYSVGEPKPATRVLFYCSSFLVIFIATAYSTEAVINLYDIRRHTYWVQFWNNLVFFINSWELFLKIGENICQHLSVLNFVGYKCNIEMCSYLSGNAYYFSSRGREFDSYQRCLRIFCNFFLPLCIKWKYC